MVKHALVRSRLSRATALGAGTLAIAFGALGIGTAQASNFQVGEVEINTQVQISAGFGIRAEDRDPRLSCPQNTPGGGITSCNTDDGDLNFDNGDLIFAPVKVQGEVEASWQNFTFYTRGQAFYDAVYDNGNLAEVGGVNDYRELSGRQTPEARHASSHDYEVMDLWVRGNFDVGDRQLVVKLGQQSISWGEALFSTLSLVQVNSLDASKLRLPGAELRDALRAMPAAFASLELGGGVSVEGFYQFALRPTRGDPAGSYFSSSDFTRGGHGAGFGGDFNVLPGRLPTAFRVPNGEDDLGDADGENFGVALRYFSPELNNTEFGLYFANIQSRTPAPYYVTASTLNLGAGALPGNVGRGELVLSNPEDVQMFGFSFNTSLESSGIALAGEFTLMHDLPVLIDPETVASAFVCASANLGIPVPCSALGLGNQLSSTTNRPGTRIDWFTREDVWTGVLRGTKLFGASDIPTRSIGANSSSVTIELGAAYVDLPKDTELAYFAPGNNTPGDGSTRDPLGGNNDAASDFSAGINVVASATYSDAFASVNLTPSVRYSTGLYGYTPVNGGYVQHSNAVTFQLDADYLLSWRASLGYTAFFGGGSANALIDRDFFQASLTYTF